MPIKILHILLDIIAIGLLIMLLRSLPTNISTGEAAPASIPISVVTKEPSSPELPAVTYIEFDKKALENILRESLQLVIKQELPERSKPNITPSVATPEQNIQAYTGSSSVVDKSLAKGVWTNEDNMMLQEHSRFLTEEQRNKLIKQIADAIDEGRLNIKDVPYGF